MITNLKSFRENLFDDYAYKEKSNVLLGVAGKRLYKECKIEEVPLTFQKSIKEHMKARTGMGASLTYDNDNFLFSNTANESLHKCFKKVSGIPGFKIRLNDLKFESVKKFIEENGLEVCCAIHTLNEDNINGSIYVNLYSQEYFIKENSTGIEEMDEYFFWKGEIRKRLTLDFTYKLFENEKIDTKEMKNKIISLFKQGERGMFANEWKQ